MLLQTIRTPGLSHLSYLIGEGGEACVVDPRRDCEIYVELARAHGLQITHVLETHRNEDLVSGAPILARLTGAKVWHGPHAAGRVVYAETAREGDTLHIGKLLLRVLETPGHTDDHLAFAVFDTSYPNGAVAVLTGDALFVGDVGRTDFYPERARAVAGQLFDSLQKILALGDHVVILPAHGAGSVCGSGMAERELSTIGHERRNNPRLQLESREAFIQAKVDEHHLQPPYFAVMERLNLEGARPAPTAEHPPMRSLEALERSEVEWWIDVRSPMAFAAAHLPRSLSLPLSLLSAFAGWFIGPRDRVALIADDAAALKEASVQLARIGIDRVVGGAAGLLDEIAGGRAFASIPMISADEARARLSRRAHGFTLLDVRSLDEVRAAKVEGAEHIYLGHLNERVRELDPSRAYTVMCASGARATIGAAWLRAHGIADVDICLGRVAR